MIHEKNTLQFLAVYSLYTYKTILHVKNNKSTYLRQLGIHSYENPRKHNFTIKKNHTKEIFKQSPTYMGKKFINYLPDNIKQGNIMKFENNNYLQSNSFLYSLQDFFTLENS